MSGAAPPAPAASSRGCVASPAAIAVCALLVAAIAGCSRTPRVIVLSDPLSAAERLDLGVAYERDGELDRAMAEYAKALRKDGRLVRARVNMGNVFLAKGRYADARREYLRALDVDGADPAAVNNLAWAAILSGSSREEALDRMDTLLADPARCTAPLLDTLGVLRARLGRTEAALAAFDAAEAACERDAAAGGGECTDAVRREIRDHRAEALPRIPSAGDAPPLVK